MNPDAQFERDLEQWLQSEAPASAPAGFHATVIDRARTLRQRPGWTTTPTVRRFGRGRGITLLAAALLLTGGALAAGSGLLRLPAASARAFPIGRSGRHGVARRDVSEPERIGNAIRESDPCRGSRRRLDLDRDDGDAWRGKGGPPSRRQGAGGRRGERRG